MKKRVLAAFLVLAFPVHAGIGPGQISPAILARGGTGSPAATPFVSDTFTAAEDTLLEDHVGETGADWTINPAYLETMQISGSGTRLRATRDVAQTRYYASGVPPDDSYKVESDLLVLSDAGFPGVCARMSTTEDTMYLFRRNTTNVTLEKRVAGAGTTLVTTPFTLVAGTTYTFRLDVTDAVKTAYIDGVMVSSTTDNAIPDAGMAGITGRLGDDTTGIHALNFTATDN